MRRGIAIGAALGVVALAAAILVWPPGDGLLLPHPGELRGANVLLITIDTLRADRLGAYGARHPTPALDALAAAGARFTRAYAHAVMTLPSHASLLTGLVPPRHGVRNNGTFRLADDVETLAERLHGSGYRTGAFVGAFVLDRRFGLAQGFETYDDRIAERHGLDFRIAERPAREVLTAASRWLADLPADQPWFAWVHVFDPHTPYAAPQARTGDPYTDEVLHVDRELGAFLDKQRAAGRLDRAIVAVTADHGESLGDHGETTHGLFAYDATLRVPLILMGPRIGRGTIETPVSHVDLAATLLALLGARTGGLDGTPLDAALGADHKPPAIYFEAMDAQLTRGGAPLTGVISGLWKYIDLPLPELYDLMNDPGETRNVASHFSDRAREMAGLLDVWHRLPAKTSRAAVDPDTAERLRSLGYSAGSPPPRTRPYTVADDPKTLLPVHRRFADALERAERGESAAAVADLKAVVAARPTFAAAYTTAASLLIAAGQPQDAVALLETAHDKGVTASEVDQRLGAALLAAGDPGGASRVLQRAVTTTPDDPEAINLLAVATLALGRAPDARRLLRRALELAPTSAGVWTNLGFLEIRAGRRVDAAAAFRRATEIDPEAVDAWRGLGATSISAGNVREAIEAWKRAVELEPIDGPTLFNLAVLMSEVAPSDAVPYLDRFLALAGTAAPDRARIAALRLEIIRTQAAPGNPKGSRR